MGAAPRAVSLAGMYAMAACLASCGREPAAPPRGGATTSVPAPRAAGLRVYVTNEGSGTLTIIDAASHLVLDTVRLGKRPRGIQASPDRKKLYVALSGSPSAPPGVDEKTLPPPDRAADGIGEIDVATARLTRILKVGTDPEQVAVSADGTRLFVANEDAAVATVYDLKADAVIKTVAVGPEPEGVTVTPNGREVYVTSEEAGEVYAIDTSTFQILSRISVGHRPRSVGFLPDGSHGFVTLENDSAVAVIDGRKRTFEQRIQLGDPAARPMGVAVDPAGQAIYVTTGRFGKLVVIDPSTRALAGSIAVGERPWGIAVTPDGNVGFTANGPSNDVSVVDLKKKTVIKKIPVGERPWGVAVVEHK